MYSPAFARLPARLAPCPEGWRRTNLLDGAATWQRYVAELDTALNRLPDIRHSEWLCGPFGEGKPILDAESVAFNGNRDAGRIRERDAERQARRKR